MKKLFLVTEEQLVASAYDYSRAEGGICELVKAHGAEQLPPDARVLTREQVAEVFDAHLGVKGRCTFLDELFGPTPDDEVGGD